MSSPINNYDIILFKKDLEKYSYIRHAYWKIIPILDYGLVIYFEVLILWIIEFVYEKFFILLWRSEGLKKLYRL